MLDFVSTVFDDGMSTAKTTTDASARNLSRGELTHLFKDVLDGSAAFERHWTHEEDIRAVDEGRYYATENGTGMPRHDGDATDQGDTRDGFDMPCIRDFDCNVGRLILDFEGTDDEAPEITIDLDTFPGDALVEANGVPVTFVADAADLTPDHVTVEMHPRLSQDRPMPRSTVWSVAVSRFMRLLARHGWTGAAQREAAIH